MEYINVSEYSFSGGSGEEGYISQGEFKVLNADFKERLHELVLEYHGSDEIEIVSIEFDCQFSSWVDLYCALIDGELVCSEGIIHIEVFEALVKEGYINNGLFKMEHYYQTKYNDYYVQNKKYKHIVSGGKEYYSLDEVIELLLKKKVIVKVADNTYSIK